MIKAGKWTKLWNRERAKLKKIYFDKGITSCELRHSPNCTPYNFLGFAHRYKRIEYRSRPDLLGSFSQTLLACQPCHDVIENNRELTDRLFKEKRVDSEDLK